MFLGTVHLVKTRQKGISDPTNRTQIAKDGDTAQDVIMIWPKQRFSAPLNTIDENNIGIPNRGDEGLLAFWPNAW